MTTIIELLGLTAVVAGVSVVYWPAGLMLGGCFAVVGAYAVEKNHHRPAGDE